jgi:hypothetical protein
MRQYTIKADHRFSNVNSMFGRYSFLITNGQWAGGASVYPNGWWPSATTI